MSDLEGIVVLSICKFIRNDESLGEDVVGFRLHLRVEHRETFVEVVTLWSTRHLCVSG